MSEEAVGEIRGYTEKSEYKVYTLFPLNPLTPGYPLLITLYLIPSVYFTVFIFFVKMKEEVRKNE